MKSPLPFIAIYTITSACSVGDLDLYPPGGVQDGTEDTDSVTLPEDTGSNDLGGGDDTSDAPELTALGASFEDDRLVITFSVLDANDDMMDGHVDLTVDDVELTFDFPYDLDDWDGLHGTLSTPSPLEGDEDCREGGEVWVTGRVVDAGGRQSNTRQTTAFDEGVGIVVPATGASRTAPLELGTITPSFSVCGTLSGSTDADHVRFVPSSTRTITFTLTWDNLLSDNDLALLDGSGEEVLQSSESVLQPELIIATVTSGVPYLLKVYPYSGGGGAYTLGIGLQ